MTEEVINFGGGPAKLPQEVLIDVQKELLNFNNSGISILEMSHRSSTYDEVHNKTINLVKELLAVPDNYKILLTQGGGRGMFAAVPLNLISKTGQADYIVTGSWSKTAAKDAERYGKINMVIPQSGKLTNVPDPSTWNFDPNASYIYYCANETIEGTDSFELPFVPENEGGVPIVCDMSSNILTKPIDVSKFGIIFACVQKNIGPAGVVIAIVREDLIGLAQPYCPVILDFAELSKSNSLLNTPPTFAIYVCGKVLEFVKQQGGVETMEKLSAVKSQIVYDVIDQSEGFYVNDIDPSCRSKTNVTFRIKGGAEMEKKFLKLAEKLKMIQLKGHRTVGGIRASLYNALTVEETAKLVGLMRSFQNEYKFSFKDYTQEE